MCTSKAQTEKSNPRAAEGGPRGSGVTGRAIWWCYSDNSSEAAGRNFFLPIGMGQGSVPACLARVSLRFVDLDYRSKSYDTPVLQVRQRRHAMSGGAMY